jgi:hypothetical protein
VAVNFDAGCFKASKRKNGVANLHRQGFTPARAAPQKSHRLTGQKAKFGQATRDPQDILVTCRFDQVKNDSAAAGRHVVDGKV